MQLAAGECQCVSNQKEKLAPGHKARKAKTTVTKGFKEALIYSSCRRRPASRSLKTLDPGMRRDDDK
jgi:hypothetical protein